MSGRAAKKRRLEECPTLVYVEGFLIPVAAANKLQAIAMQHALEHIKALEHELATARAELKQWQSKAASQQGQPVQTLSSNSSSLLLDDLDEDNWGPWTSQGLTNAAPSASDPALREERQERPETTPCMLMQWEDEISAWKRIGLGQASLCQGALQFINGQGVQRLPRDPELDLERRTIVWEAPKVPLALSFTTTEDCTKVWQSLMPATTPASSTRMTTAQ